MFLRKTNTKPPSEPTLEDSNEMLTRTFKYGSLALFILLGLFFAVTAPAAPIEKHDEFLQQEKFTGDFDEMNKRHVIRALVVYNDMLYFFDHGQARGAAYEGLKIFEKFINKKLKNN